jgi:hypothetical protein
MVMPQVAPVNQNQRQGQTFGGQGQPMDIDRQRRPGNSNCNRCGRPGHWARNCQSRTRLDGTPLAPQQVRRNQQGSNNVQPQRQDPQNQRVPPPPRAQPRRDIRALIAELDDDDAELAVLELVNRLGN